VRWAALVLFAAVLAVAPARAEPGDAYSALIYDHEVAAQCGLLTPRVRQAFHAARDRLAARSGLAAAHLKKLRLKAIVAADREYNNRGLGGYRQWCAGEGRGGVTRILRAADET